MSHQRCKLLKINKKVEYALMALKFMAERDNDKLTTAREICDRFHTPFDTVAKVMQSLNNKNILSSVKGIKGGYQLNIPLEKLTYKQIETIIEGNESDSVCKGRKGLCDLYEHCNITLPVERLNAQINQFLSNLTLEELLLENGETSE